MRSWFMCRKGLVWLHRQQERVCYASGVVRLATQLPGDAVGGAAFFLRTFVRFAADASRVHLWMSRQL